MRRAALAVLSALLCLTAAGQIQIRTKKFKIADFPLKTTKVVLTGNEMVDAVLQKEVMERWVISPFEFCTGEEFEEIKRYDAYYFLMIASGGSGKEGIDFLTVRKGGAQAGESLDNMLEVIWIPYAATGTRSIRGLVFLPALIDIIQDFIPKALENDLTGYAGLNSYGNHLRKKKICLAEEDLSGQVTEEVRNRYFSGALTAVDEDEADDLFDSGEEGVLVSYVVAPEDRQKGGSCYKMLIDAGTHRLCYFRSSKVKAKVKPGFDAGDIRKLAKGN